MFGFVLMLKMLLIIFKPRKETDAQKRARVDGNDKTSVVTVVTG